MNKVIHFLKVMDISFQTEKIHREPRKKNPLE